MELARPQIHPLTVDQEAVAVEPDPMRGGLTELRKIATVADTWNMTIDPVAGRHTGQVRIELPARPFIALRLTRDDDAAEVRD